MESVLFLIVGNYKKSKAKLNRLILALHADIHMNLTTMETALFHTAPNTLKINVYFAITDITLKLDKPVSKTTSIVLIMMKMEIVINALISILSRLQENVC